MQLSDSSVFRLAIESAPTGILLCDEAGTIVFANRLIEQIFGYASFELSGRSVDDLLPSANRPAHQAARQGFWQHPQSRAMGAGRDLTGRRKDRTEVPVEVGLTVTHSAGQRLVIASVVDISDRLALQNRLTETAREQTAFEHLVTELATRFARVPPDQVDDAIIDSLARVSEILSLDRSSWWVAPDDSKDLLIKHTWTRPEYRVMQSGDSASALVPFVLAALQRGEVVANARVDDVPDPTDRESLHRFGVKSNGAVPFLVEGSLRAALGFGAIRQYRDWTPDLIDRLRLVATVFGQAVVRKESDERLTRTMAQLQQLRDQLTAENVLLRREVKMLGSQHVVVAESAAARRVIEQIESVAATDATVLLMGETGTGKEVFAQAIHRASQRRGRPMVTVNCAALPATLIESELFGRERGAYTGALARQIGRFEMAHDSTIFLDEIGDLPLEAQVKLLRVLQERVIERLGGGQPIKVNVRIIAATNRNLEKAVEDRAFREDLFYRLNVFPVTVPPLRERVADIPALVWTFIEEYSGAFRKPIESISKETLAQLKAYRWPGNVRELRNVIERAVILAKGSRLVVDLPTVVAAPPRASTRLDEAEAEQIRRVLESVGWRIRGAGGAAELLGLKPNTLDSRMTKLGIRRPGFRSSQTA